MVFHWSLSDSRSRHLSRTLLSILAVLNNAVVWMVSTRLPTSKYSSPFSNPLVTVPNAPITIGIIVTCMFHSFFVFPSKVEELILLFTFFKFYSVFSRDNKVDYFACSLFFFFCWLLLSLVSLFIFFCNLIPYHCLKFLKQYNLMQIINKYLRRIFETIYHFKYSIYWIGILKNI